MSKYRGLFTYDVDNHRYLPIEQADGIIANMDYHPGPEPLIKDEKIRKAVRAWAEVEGETQVQVTHCRRHILSIWSATKENGNIDFDCDIEDTFDEGFYSINQLCGEEEE